MKTTIEMRINGESFMIEKQTVQTAPVPVATVISETEPVKWTSALAL